VGSAADENLLVDTRASGHLLSAPQGLNHFLAAARAAYQDFLTLWKDADPDIPILREVKSEYEKLK
jgi:hypothetical protein